MDSKKQSLIAQSLVMAIQDFFMDSKRQSLIAQSLAHPTMFSVDFPKKSEPAMHAGPTID